MKTHKDLEIWKDGMALVNAIYKECRNLPQEEKFGLESQLKRASVSIPVNIAEGATRNHNKEFIQFTYIALGSLVEVDTLLLICLENNLLTNLKELLEKIEILRRKILAFIKYLKSYQSAVQ